MMKQPLMPVRIPPAQAEALFDDALKGGSGSAPPARDTRWPGEDWDDDVPADAKGPPRETLAPDARFTRR